MVDHPKTFHLITAAAVSLVLAGCGGSSSSSSDPEPTPPAPSSPTVTLSSSADSVTRGGKVTLTWSTQNAESCEASGDWSGSQATSGTAESGNLRKQSNTFTLTCSGGGQSDEKSVTVSTTDVTKPEVYAGFPVTLSGMTGDDSVSYRGQMARHVLREQLKATIKVPNQGYAGFAIFDSYYENPDDAVDYTPIIAPKSTDNFTFLETSNNELGTGKNLSGKVYDPEGYGDPIPGVAAEDAAKTMGWPGEPTAAEVMAEWRAYWGADQAGHVDGPNGADHVNMTTGYDYSQLVPKFLMGAVFYNQTVDKYLDEYMAADKKPNNEGYKSDSIYTGKEHSWDEAFGYFGAAAHYAELTAEQNYEIAKRGKNLSDAEAAALADKNGDGKVSLYTEYNSGPAYYASSFDKSGLSTYGADIVNAFLAGRTVIANAVDAEGNARVFTDAERTELMGYAATIQHNWEMVFAEAVFKYAGESYEEAEKLDSGAETDPSEYYKVWSELKGFMMALQYGGANSTMNKDKFMEIDALIGYGPVMPDGRQVSGSAPGTPPIPLVYEYFENQSLTDYMAKLQEVQVLIDDLYTLKVRLYDNRP